MGKKFGINESKIRDADDFMVGSNALHEGETHVSRDIERLSAKGLDVVVQESQTMQESRHLDGFGESALENSFKLDGDMCDGFSANDNNDNRLTDASKSSSICLVST